MAGGVSGYAAVSARVRVKYSKLLGAAELRELLDAPDLAAFGVALKQTRYADVLQTGAADDSSGRVYLDAFRRGFASEARSVIRAMPGNTRSVVDWVLRRHELNNVKATLRAIAAGPVPANGRSTWERVQPLLFPTEGPAGVAYERIAEAGSVAAAVELLRGTTYHEPLAFALKRYSSEQSLFPLEVALDISYWRSVWQEARKLSGGDHWQATRVVGSLVDSHNLMWVIRYRVYQHLTEEELINYTLPFGYRVHDTDIRAIAAGADIGSVIERLYPDLLDVKPMVEQPGADLSRLETELRRWLMQNCLNAFLGDPFHVGLPLAYIVLHDLELDDLTTILEAKASGARAAEYQPYLVRSFSTS